MRRLINPLESAREHFSRTFVRFRLHDDVVSSLRQAEIERPAAAEQGAHF